MKRLPFAALPCLRLLYRHFAADRITDKDGMENTDSSEITMDDPTLASRESEEQNT